MGRLSQVSNNLPVPKLSHWSANRIAAVIAAALNMIPNVESGLITPTEAICRVARLGFSSEEIPFEEPAGFTRIAEALAMVVSDRLASSASSKRFLQT